MERLKLRESLARLVCNVMGLPTVQQAAFGGVNRYVSSAGASPIPNRLGSLNNFTAGVIVAYSFTWNGF